MQNVNKKKGNVAPYRLASCSGLAVARAAGDSSNAQLAWLGVLPNIEKAKNLAARSSLVFLRRLDLRHGRGPVQHAIRDLRSR